MEKESEGILLRIFIGESNKYMGRPLHQYLVEFFKKEGLAGATVLRGMSGFGKTSVGHSASMLRLSTDLPIVIEVVDMPEKIDAIKEKLEHIVKHGMITQEKVKILLYEGRKAAS
jgi:hypothetical protein